jgi:hypothetical protein
MVNKDFEVKLIDFDISAYDGNKVSAAGNFDFCTEEIRRAILINKRISASKSLDLYPLALCCLLLIADKDRIYLRSLSAETPLNDREREAVITKENYKGKEAVEGLMRS